MKIYIYDDDNLHVATITGDNNESCEKKAEKKYPSNDYGWTYTPAFGASDGLTENENAEIINA